MSTITTRAGKGTPLTHSEVDANFTNLNSDKYEAGDSPSFGSITVTGTVDGRDVAADGSKLDGIEAGADVTDTANVTAAGALMDSEVTNLAAVKAFDPADYVEKTAVTGSAEIPTGTEAQRDATPNAGYFRFNNETAQFEGYNGTSWGSVGGGATGSAGDQVFVQNDQVVTADYTIPPDKNAMSTGPITINPGATVTVSTGARYVVI